MKPDPKAPIFTIRIKRQTVAWGPEGNTWIQRGDIYQAQLIHNPGVWRRSEPATRWVTLCGLSFNSMDAAPINHMVGATQTEPEGENK